MGQGSSFCRLTEATVDVEIKILLSVCDWASGGPGGKQVKALTAAMEGKNRNLSMCLGSLGEKRSVDPPKKDWRC